MVYDNNDGPIYSMLSGKTYAGITCVGSMMGGLSCEHSCGYDTDWFVSNYCTSVGGGFYCGECPTDGLGNLYDSLGDGGISGVWYYNVPRPTCSSGDSKFWFGPCSSTVIAYNPSCANSCYASYGSYLYMNNYSQADCSGSGSMQWNGTCCCGDPYIT